MFINTPYGKAEVPNCYVNEYKNKTDIELLEILINQNKRFLDPVLVQICVDKNLLRKGEAKEDLEMKLDDLKIQAYSELKAENERLATLNNQYATQLEQNYNKKPDLQNLCNNLQQQLKEKDEEIEQYQKLINDICKNFAVCSLKEIPKAINHQVCEKIRKLWKEQAVYYHICDSGEKLNNKSYQCTILGMNEILFDDMIKKIEKGE